ncbi:MAG: Hsp20/alpha crystallin family protein [Gammaproteobacteria bacterium]|nr:Hsp20/alpha crystallin family protein [Gammaproteobacteria bacterium]
MSVFRYEPWNLHRQLQNEINRVLETSLAGSSDEDSSSVVTSHWTPAVDIKEEKDRFVLYADIPGVDPAQISITMDSGVLTVQGERVAEEDQERDAFKRMERARGTFYRRFSLPDTADPERISARGSHGVLQIVIPKQEKLQPRRINVEV